MRRTNLKLIAAAWILASSLNAAETALGGGSVAGSWTLVRSTPAEAVYGQSLGALGSGALAGRLDPSALAKLASPRVDLAYHQYVEGMSVQNVTGGLPLGKLGGLGLSARYFNLGSVDEITVLPGNQLSKGKSLNLNAMALESQWGLEWRPGLRAGVGAAWISENLGTVQASALQFSAGLGAALPSNLAASLGVTGLGSGLYGATAPSQLNAGLAWRGLTEQRLALGLGLSSALVGGEALRLSLATDYSFDMGLNLRAGYHHQQYGVSGPAVGMGYRLSKVEIEYSLQLGTVLGASHLVGMNYDFGPGK